MRSPCRVQDAHRERALLRRGPVAFRGRSRRWHTRRSPPSQTAPAALEDSMTILASATGLGVAIYLLIALLQPERFS